MQKLNNQPKKLDHIGIDRIIFDHSDWVSLWGFRLNNGRKERMDYIISFDLLNKLLRLSGKEGDQIQMLMVEKLENGIEEPSVIDLEQMTGKPAFFNQCILEVSDTWEKNPEGSWKKDQHCLSIDGVYPVLEKRQQTLSQKTRYRQTLLQCEEMLADAYALYLGYLELEIDDDTALKMADLEDDLKFKMAYYAWKMNQKAA